MAIRLLKSQEPTPDDATRVVGAYVLGELNDRLARVQDELTRTTEDIEALREELDAARERLASA